MSRARKSGADGPRIYICTSATEIRVHGAGPKGLGKVLTAGAQVDFDEVIGHAGDGAPVTLEQALGARAGAFFTPAQPAAAPPVAQDEE